MTWLYEVTINASTMGRSAPAQSSAWNSRALGESQQWSKCSVRTMSRFRRAGRLAIEGVHHKVKIRIAVMNGDDLLSDCNVQ